MKYLSSVGGLAKSGIFVCAGGGGDGAAIVAGPCDNGGDGRPSSAAQGEGPMVDKLRRAYRAYRSIPFRLAGLRARWHELTSIFRR